MEGFDARMTALHQGPHFPDLTVPVRHYSDQALHQDGRLAQNASRESMSVA